MCIRDRCEGTGSVDADPYEQAKVNCELALKKIPKNAKVVVLQGPAGNFHSTKRREAWKKEFFDKRSDVKILAEDIANWNKDEAMPVSYTHLTSTDIGVAIYPGLKEFTRMPYSAHSMARDLLIWITPALEAL